MKQFITGKEVSQKTFKRELDINIREKAIKDYEQFLDEGKSIIVRGVVFYPSQLLKNLEPKQYNNDLSLYIEQETFEAETVLINTRYIFINDVLFEIEDEEKDFEEVK